MRVDVSGLPLTVVLLGSAVGNLFLAAAGSDKPDARTALVSSAVIHLLKRVAIIQADPNSTDVIRTFGANNNLHLLCNLVDLANDVNKCKFLMSTSASSRFEDTPASFEQDKKHLLTWYLPSNPSSDVLLFRVLFDPLPTNAECVDYRLVLALLRTRHDSRGLHSPIPPPPRHVQVRCIYVAAHHCCIQTLVLMSQQQRLQQQPHQHVDVTTNPVLGARHLGPNTCSDLHQLILSICAHPRLQVWKNGQGGYAVSNTCIFIFILW